MKKTALVLLASFLITVLAGCSNSQAEKSGWVCANCSNQNNEGNFCQECGEEKPTNNKDTWKCKECGATATGKFCQECGASKTGKDESSSSESKPVNSSTESKVESSSSESQVESSSSESSVESSTSEIEVSKAGTLENPGKFNEWVPIKLLNSKTSDYETAYIKLKEIVKGERCKDIIEEHNAASSFIDIKYEEQDGLELCAVYYDIKYPTDWDARDNGFTVTRPRISIRGYDGNYVKHNGSMLYSSTTDATIPNYSARYHPGDIAEDNICLFSMFIDFDGFLFEITDGKSGKLYIGCK